MNLLTDCLLKSYYFATLPARRRAAVDRAANQTEPVRVLFYHRVANEHPNDWTISTTRFATQIAWLQDRYDIASLGEAQARIAAGRNRFPTVAITFDDGYADNLKMALPLLLREKIPFTYFVSTDHVQRNEPFPHDVALSQPLAPHSPTEIQQLANAGVEIGAHTRSHADLGGQLSIAQLTYEIEGSKRELEKMIGREVRYFAFPFGQPQNMSTDAFRVALDAGFHGVCSAYGGYNFPGHDPFHIRRFHGDPSMARFKNWLTVDPRKLKSAIHFDPGDYKSSSIVVADSCL